MNLSDRIRSKALEAGFDVVGIGPVREAPHAGAFLRWLDQGRQADMEWLGRDPGRRVDPRHVVENARSAVCVGLSYFTEDPPGTCRDDPMRGRVARYAWGRDYHDVMTPMLRSLTDFIRQEAGDETRSRYYVDTGPVLERETAWQAGLGFVGRNSLLIHPRFGSYLFLGEILTDLELDFDPPATENGARIPPEQNHGKAGTCGACTRCLEVCPTQAIVEPYTIDSRRCISYQTIENKGGIPGDLQVLMQNWIFGCDACQMCCPWVHRHARSGQQRFLSFDPDCAAPRLDELAALDEEGFRTRFRGTPIRRIKRRGLLRNVMVALGNSGQPEARSILEQALRDPEPLVQAQAAQSLERL